MTSIDALLAEGIGAGTLTLPETFQGLPGMAHGGSVLAAFDAVARRHSPAGPREIFGAYRWRVPLNTPLALEARPAGSGTEFRLSKNQHLLVEGRVSPDQNAPAPTGLPEALWGGFPLPISKSCFACGVENPLGLQVTLRFDAQRVWTEYRPRAPLKTEEGRLSTAALTTLLDEAAFWLGVLATGESGMTTELRVTVHRAAVRFGEPLIVFGQRERVRSRDDDPRYQETEAAVFGADGARLATGRITFVAMRGAAKRLVERMLGVNPPEVVRRVFPAYAE